MNMVRLKASLSKSFHIQPSEVDNMPMWEFELYIKQLNELVEEENERNKADEDSKDMRKYRKMADPGYIRRTAQSAMPKMNMPSIPNMSGFR